jgi:hypothetical protein
MRSGSFLAAFIGVVAAVALAPSIGYAQAIHGFCVGTAPACVDNNTVTPLPTNPPSNFTFTAGGQSASGDLFLDVLIPNVGTAPASLTVTITGDGTFTASRVDTVFNSGDLATFLTNNATNPPFTTTNFSSAQPNNPVGGFPGSTTGFFVFMAELGQQTLGDNNNVPAGPNLNIVQTVPNGTSIVAFLNTGTASAPNFRATALSGQLFVPGPVVGAGWPGVVAACGALLALARRRRQKAA